MAKDSAQTGLPALVEHILPLVTGLIERPHEGIAVLGMEFTLNRV